MVETSYVVASARMLPTPPMNPGMQFVEITMDDGTQWYGDMTPPPNTQIMNLLYEWIEAGGVVTPLPEE